MTPLDVTELIYQTAADGIPSATARLVFGSERSDVAGAPWVRLSVVDLPPLASTHGPVGNRLALQRGSLRISAFVPLATSDGDGPALTLATTVRDLFHGRSLNDSDPVTFGAASVGVVPDDGPWRRADARIPFTYHEQI